MNCGGFGEVGAVLKEALICCRLLSASFIRVSSSKSFEVYSHSHNLKVRMA